MNNVIIYVFLITLIRYITSRQIISVQRQTHEADNDIVEYDCGAGIATPNLCGENSFKIDGCRCKCHRYSVFKISENKCTIFTTVNRFLLSTEDNIINKDKISKYSPQELRSGIKLHYCFNSNSCTSAFNSCNINTADIDKLEVTPLWTRSADATISINDQNVLMILSSAPSYDGFLLRLNIVCLQTEQPSQQFSGELLIEVAGTVQVQSLTTTSRPKTSTSTKITSTSTKTITTTLPTTTTPSTTKPSKTSTTTPSPIITTVSQTTTTPKTAPASTTSSKFNTNTKEPVKITTTSTIQTTRNQSKGNSSATTVKEKVGKEDSKMFLLIVILPSALVFLFLLCIVLLLCRKCQLKRRNKKRRSEPVSLFQPTTPVFLVDRGGRADISFIGISDPLYDLYHYGKGSRPVKSLYAQIGKKLRKKNRSVEGSLDDGYITDESDYRKKFAHFPPDLYSCPGSIISLNEPDYKIPEDINYLANHRPPPYSSYHKTSVYQRNSFQNKENTENNIPSRNSILKKHYSDFDEEETFSSFKKILSEDSFKGGEENSFNEENAYDQVGMILQSSLFNSSVNSFYDEIYNKVTEEKDVIDPSTLYSKPIKIKKNTKDEKEDVDEIQILVDDKTNRVKLARQKKIQSHDNKGFKK